MAQEVDKVLECFEKINSIPRCSKDEGRIGQWLQQWARAKGFDIAVDVAGNIVVRVPDATGDPKAPTVIIQGHMDMVCEKTPDSTHDFDKDPIRSIREGDWLRADRTTLGADNGIAIAYAMALAEDKTILHPPLELLFTVDEETGLNGVKEMAPEMVSGRILINLDSEDEGVFTIGCAGGAEALLSLLVKREALSPDARRFRVLVGGLRGGHSGIDIHKPRGNANQILARTLARIQQAMPCRLVALKGGTRHNAIARDAEATIALARTDEGRLRQVINQMAHTIQSEYAAIEPSLFIKVQSAADPTPSLALATADTNRVIELILALPHGVAAMSTALDGLVETSSNLATVALKEDCVEILSSQRSAQVSRLEEITAKVHAVGRLAGATVRDHNHYPPWPPDMAAPLLAQSRETYGRLFGRSPAIQVIHAGLECAIIGDRSPGMQMISFGPTIENPHSPSERLHVPSVGKVWQFLVALLEDLGSML